MTPNSSTDLPVDHRPQPAAAPEGWPDLADLSGVAPISYQQANILLNARVIKRREAIDELDLAQRAEADSERDYRKAKLEAWGRAPDGPAAYRTAWVDAEVADHRRARDINKARVKTAQARIAQLKDEQVDIFWRGNWAKLIDPVGGVGS